MQERLLSFLTELLKEQIDIPKVPVLISSATALQSKVEELSEKTTDEEELDVLDRFAVTVASFCHTAQLWVRRHTPPPSLPVEEERKMKKATEEKDRTIKKLYDEYMKQGEELRRKEEQLQKQAEELRREREAHQQDREMMAKQQEQLQLERTARLNEMEEAIRREDDLQRERSSIMAEREARMRIEEELQRERKERVQKEGELTQAVAALMKDKERKKVMMK